MWVVRSDGFKSRVMITGGAGYVGSFCVRLMLKIGHEVVVLDRQPMPAWGRGDVVEAVGDITDASFVRRVLADQPVDAVLHLAAEKSVEESVARPGPHLRNNLLGSITLLEEMRAAGVGKIVFSSSAAVYGTPDTLPVGEDAPLRPENPYGSGKAMVEQILHWYHVSHGFDAVSLRYFNAAGASDDGRMGEDWTHAHNLVPRVMKALCGVSGPLPVFGTDFPTPDGTAVRDYVHVEDLAAAHVRALGHVIERGGESVFNLGTGRGYSVRQVLAAAERTSGWPVPHEDAPRRAGDPAAVWADVRAAERVLDWRAERDLDDIMGTAWRWHSREGGECR
jgi:UDP-glucose 4-epimerase